MLLHKELQCFTLSSFLILYKSMDSRSQHSYYGQGIYFHHEPQARSAVGHCLLAGPFFSCCCD